MRKTILFILLLSLVFSLAADKFVDGAYERNNIVVSFKMDTIGNIDGTIPVTYDNGIVQTNIESFNQFARDFAVTEIKQDCPFVKDKEWNDNGQYIQCIYKITIKDHNRIEQALDTIQKSNDINWAQYVTINRTYYTPNDQLYSTQWFITQTETDQVWDFVRDASDVVIGITDSGIKWNHPDLQDLIFINQAEMNGATIDWENGTFTGNGLDDDNNGKVDDVMGWDFNANGGEDNNPMQTFAANYHGTHVAGCASAEGDNGIGTAGPAFNARLINCKGAIDNGESTGIAQGYPQIVYCADLGADIINASWGGQTSSLYYANNYINYAHNHGSLVVAAAGNGNLLHGNGYMDAPADCDNAFCVAALELNDTKASFSDYGDPIDISAPGVQIRSTIIENNGWGNAQGTSMASPIVAGIAALVKAAHPELTNTQIRQRIEYTADYIDDINEDYTNQLGAGRINAYTAVLYDLVPKISVVESELTEVSGDNDGVVNPGDVASLKVRLTNHQDLNTGISWANSNDTEVTLRCDYPGIVIQDSVATIGNIVAGNFVWNDDEPFSFTSSSDVTTAPIEFTLHIVSNQDEEIPYTKDITFEISLSLSHANWPYATDSQAQSAPIVLDMDGQAGDEVIFADLAGNVHVLNGANEEMSGFPVNVGTQVLLPVAIGDLNNDDTMDIAVVNSSKELYAIANDGSIIYGPISLNNQMVKASPMIADMNNDGVNDVVVCTMTGTLHIFNQAGEEHDGYPVSYTGNFVFNNAIADMNNDGSKEIILQAINGNILVIDYNTTENIDGFPFAIGANTEAAPIVVNLDDDNYPELLVTEHSSGMVFGVDHDGSTLFSHQMNITIKKDVLVADFNGDGAKEILFVSYNGNVGAINLDGEYLPNFPLDMGGFLEGNMILANLDGDGLCMIFGDAAGYLHAIKSDTSEANNFPIYLNDNLKFTPAIGDVDGDDDLDIAVANISGMQLLDMKRNGYGAWTMYKGNPQRTANMFEAYTDVDDNDVAVYDNGLIGNYPNPFNPETTISYNLEKSADVQINVYNIKGQLVKNLVNDHKAAGNHTVVWNGKDNNNNNVSSGVYFYKMKGGKYSKTKKMILMK